MQAESVSFVTEASAEENRESAEARPSKFVQFSAGCQLDFTLSYSELNSCLVVSLGRLTGVTRPFSRGNDHVRVSITLLPTKIPRTTKLHILDDKGNVGFGETFKFPDVPVSTLASYVIRFRLYGKISDTFEVCVGQMCYQLSQMSDRKGNVISTSQMFEKTKMKLKYLNK